MEEIMSESKEDLLRAMARNYKPNNLWDHLDTKAVIEAADEIATLTAKLEAAEKDNKLLEDINGQRWNQILEQAVQIEARKADAERWKYYVANPYRATDIILDACPVNTPAYWKDSCNAAIDLAREVKSNAF
jgi:hypothetical protein